MTRYGAITGICLAFVVQGCAGAIPAPNIGTESPPNDAAVVPKSAPPRPWIYILERNETDSECLAGIQKVARVLIFSEKTGETVGTISGDLECPVSIAVSADDKALAVANSKSVAYFTPATSPPYWKFTQSLRASGPHLVRFDSKDTLYAAHGSGISEYSFAARFLERIISGYDIADMAIDGDDNLDVGSRDVSGKFAQYPIGKTASTSSIGVLSPIGRLALAQKDVIYATTRSATVQITIGSGITLKRLHFAQPAQFVALDPERNLYLSDYDAQVSPLKVKVHVLPAAGTITASPIVTRTFDSTDGKPLYITAMFVSQSGTLYLAFNDGRVHAYRLESTSRGYSLTQQRFGASANEVTDITER